MPEKKVVFPGLEEIDAELRRIRAKRRRAKWRRAMLLLMVLALVAGAVVSLNFFSFLKVSGNSMEPTLKSGDVVLYRKEASLEPGSIVVIERSGTTIVKRIIGIAGDIISITATGSVYVNVKLLEEDYLDDKSLGNGDLTYPVTVPENCYFVMGDRRSTSFDSRTSALGMVKADEIKGELLGVIWPAYRIGWVQ